jgi:hypothetical protein
MADDDDIADDLIPGSLKRSKSYHRDYGQKTYDEIKRLAKQKPPDRKARQMKKLIENARRLRDKESRRPKRWASTWRPAGSTYPRIRLLRASIEATLG